MVLGPLQSRIFITFIHLKEHFLEISCIFMKSIKGPGSAKNFYHTVLLFKNKCASVIFAQAHLPVVEVVVWYVLFCFAW